MAFFTKDEARAAARAQRVYKSDDQILRESVSAARDYENFDIFLSHSSQDAELVRGVKLLLEAQGLRVYVDWIADPQLDRTKVSKATAELLRKRMSQCQSLIYMATQNAAGSKWMPWELGYFDGLRKGNVAILPLTDRAEAAFSGQEYLGLYPIVQKGAYMNGAKDVFVEERGHRWTTLASFGNGVPTWRAYSP